MRGPAAAEPDPAGAGLGTWRARLAICNGCDDCGPACVDGVPMSRAEYLRLKRYLASLPPADRARVLAQNKRLPWPGAPSITYVACPFRDVELGRCLVYPARPLVCRLFGHVEWLPCPAGKVPAPAASGVRLFQRYSELELKTFSDWEDAGSAAGS